MLLNTDQQCSRIYFFPCDKQGLALSTLLVHESELIHSKMGISGWRVIRFLRGQFRQGLSSKLIVACISYNLV